ncbi:MAG: hypothetical protein KCHDKBKB_01180 [Elusimicrobia bacterium]|nr:hypothetical protein [Elusimicrobiota bacterium]
MKGLPFWRVLLSVLGLALTIWFFIKVWSILIPFLLGLVLAYLIQPLVDRFVAMGLRRDRIVLLLYLGCLLSVLFASFWLVPTLIVEVNSSLESIPIYAKKFNAFNDQITLTINAWLARYMGKGTAHISLPFHVDKLASQFFSHIPENISSLAHFGMWIVIIPFVCYFGLAQGKNWMKTLFDWTPSDYVEHLLGLMAEVNATLGGYVRGQLLDAICVGSMTMAGLWVLGFEQAVLMGILSGLLNPIPFLAPILGGGLTLLLASFQGLPLSTLVGIVSLFLLVRLCDDFVFMPFVVGQRVRLHPVIMLFSILAGVEVGGFLGLVFAVPLAAITKVIVLAILNRRKVDLTLEAHHIVS